MTSDRNGNKPVKLLLVEMEDSLNAGHCVEPSSEMQLCAIAVGILLASSAMTTDFGAMIKVNPLFVFPLVRMLMLLAMLR